MGFRKVVNISVKNGVRGTEGCKVPTHLLRLLVRFAVKQFLRSPIMFLWILAAACPHIIP